MSFKLKRIWASAILAISASVGAQGVTNSSVPDQKVEVPIATNKTLREYIDESVDIKLKGLKILAKLVDSFLVSEQIMIIYGPDIQSCSLLRENFDAAMELIDVLEENEQRFKALDNMGVEEMYNYMSRPGMLMDTQDHIRKRVLNTLGFCVMSV